MAGDSKPVYIVVGHANTGTPVIRGPFSQQEDAQQARDEIAGRKDIPGSSILEREIV